MIERIIEYGYSWLWKGTPVAIAIDVLTRLRGDILKGDIGPGDRINIDRMRADYGVSLSPMREALSKLVGEGLVQSDANRGFRVAAVSLGELQEIFWLRVNLETMALTRAIERGDDAWEADIVAALHRLEKLSYIADRDASRPNEEWEEWHRRFHNALIAGGGAPLLEQFCNSLHDHADRYRRTFLRGNVQSRDTHQEHRDIAAATIGRDVQRACALMTAHLERTGHDIERAMQAEGAVSPT